MSYKKFKPLDEQITWDENGPKATINVLCPWDEAVLVCQEAVGRKQTINGQDVYTPGWPYTEIPSLQCNGATLVPFGPGDEDTLSWDLAKITFTFGRRDDQKENEDDNPNEIGTLTYSVSAQELQLEKAEAKTMPGSESDTYSEGAAEPVPEGEAKGVKIIPSGELTISIKGQRKLNLANWEAYVGKVNSVSFRGATKEKIMFNGVENRKTLSSDGKIEEEHQYKFTYNPFNWNKSFIDGTWQYVFFEGNKRYEQADLNELFATLKGN